MYITIGNVKDSIRNRLRLSGIGIRDLATIHRRCDQKITVIFKCRKLLMFDFNIFFCYVGKHVCECTYFGLSVCF